ncbi:MAG TPA: ATP-dependent DNA helicase RecG [Candidatus Megamonas gallistercoris]|nr:ATP-dependent DNA helicase RecG [Candidatus Megamonas gallistercoris]
MDIRQNVQYLKGVGPKKAQALKKIGIETIYDLSTYYPRRYEDLSSLQTIGSLKAGETANIQGKIVAIADRNTRRGLKLLTVMINDDTGCIQINFFNQDYLKKKFKQGMRLFVHGKIGYAYGGYGQLAVTQLISFDTENDKETENHYAFMPVYTLPDYIKPKDFRNLIEQVIKTDTDFKDIVPEFIRTKYQLLPKKKAVSKIHFPQNGKELEEARRTLIFEELFSIQAGLLLLKKQHTGRNKGIKFLPSSKMVKAVFNAIPFELTAEQQKVWQEICRDMQSDKQMQRLVQGDVGSGKTVIAILALVKAVENGYQGAMMAPTEILAIQHFDKIKSLLEPLGINVAILTGSLKAKQRRNTVEGLADGTVDIVIGTHALIQDNIIFKNLGIVVTDEQHRFGVNQRAKLENKGMDFLPDVLVMTATPIPRTMTLTVYGDLDVSFIRQLPPGRKPIRTFVRMPDRRELIYKFVRGEVTKGRQAYVVCPLIEESENSDAVSVEMIYDELTSGYLYGIRCALLHGKLSSKDKEQLLYDFLAGKIDVLISTTVIEVGVNVPNASIMVIEGAERFGLAQLHQLRGRIGRGEFASYCILVNRGRNANSLERLHLMEKISDGFVLAEEDLRLRGPGQFFGSMQHGLPDLKIADVLNDVNVLITARKEAQRALDFGIDKNSLVELLQMQYKDKFIRIADI